MTPLELFTNNLVYMSINWEAHAQSMAWVGKQNLTAGNSFINPSIRYKSTYMLKSLQLAFIQAFTAL